MTIAAVLGHFVHGLVFFTLGLTVSFLHYRSRRISLARHLGWLGGFAVGEALYAWYEILALLLPAGGFLPVVVPPIILASAYTCLLVFGLQTFMSEETYRSRSRMLWMVLSGFWLGSYLLALWAFNVDEVALAGTAEVLARNLLAFPGGVLTAIGLRRQSYQSLDSVLRARIRPALRLIEITMGIFGLLNLVMVPGVDVTVADRFGFHLIDSFVTGWVWAVVGAGITVGLVRSLTTIHHEIEDWVEGVERLQAMAEDRERIGRDLHDGIIQSIYAAGLLLESIVPVIRSDPDRAQGQVGRVIDNLNFTIQDIRRYIFDLRSDMPDDDLQPGIEHLLRDFHVNTLLQTEFEVMGTVHPIHSMARRRHILQIVREALANTAKHAQARWVRVRLAYDTDSLTLMISDDGVGMEKLLISKGYGLRNIRERTRLLDGTLRIESAPGAGVTFDLTVPYA